MKVMCASHSYIYVSVCFHVPVQVCENWLASEQREKITDKVGWQCNLNKKEMS